MKNKLRYPAFTLIELLAVIAVIAVLTMIAIPAISSGIQRARTTDCLSNLRQLQTSVLQYVNDNNGFLPDKPNAEWLGELWPYLYETDYVPIYGNSLPLVGTVFCCPEADGSDNPAPKRSYGMNAHLIDNNAFTLTHMSQIIYPADTASIADNALGSMLSASQMAARHSGLCNVAFLDGHVESIEPTDDIAKDYAYRSVFWRGVIIH
ncbi:MAG: prepilin-type N-terminal cleavage/methylation domain-containing protein [Verrucomicrobiota bacterium JB024]|nr:prepilin-type N-terminal cleavage/methylation domain-containing protein [Verrucomicrobiota bacterium JB024]